MYDIFFSEIFSIDIFTCSMDSIEYISFKKMTHISAPIKLKLPSGVRILTAMLLALDSQRYIQVVEVSIILIGLQRNSCLWALQSYYKKGLIHSKVSFIASPIDCTPYISLLPSMKADKGFTSRSQFHFIGEVGVEGVMAS